MFVKFPRLCFLLTKDFYNAHSLTLLHYLLHQEKSEGEWLGGTFPEADLFPRG